jgi:hypothetical protein
MKKIFVLIITFLVIGLTVVQAQTAQQQRELEQIAMRSVNGLSAQDRQRVIQIMTDVYVAQGMSRQQAAPLAEMAANSMFSDYQEDAQSAEARRQVEESEQQQRRQLEERNRNLAELEQQQRQQGQTAGWPTATILRGFGLSNLKQPVGTQSSYTNEYNRVVSIYLTGANANTLQDVKRQIETIMKGQMESLSSNTYYKYGDGFIIRIILEGNTLKIELTQSAG